MKTVVSTEQKPIGSISRPPAQMICQRFFDGISGICSPAAAAAASAAGGGALRHRHARGDEAEQERDDAGKRASGAGVRDAGFARCDVVRGGLSRSPYAYFL